jgi:hypothetical protein
MTPEADVLSAKYAKTIIKSAVNIFSLFYASICSVELQFLLQNPQFRLSVRGRNDVRGANKLHQLRKCTALKKKRQGGGSLSFVHVT